MIPFLDDNFCLVLLYDLCGSKLNDPYTISMLPFPTEENFTLILSVEFCFMLLL